MNKKTKSKNIDDVANPSNSEQDSFASDFLDALFKPVLQELERDLDGLSEDNENQPNKKIRKSKKDEISSKPQMEIHISGRIDSFVFGALKEPYFEEFKNSHLALKDSGKNKNFLRSMFSLFLENDPFSEKSNLELFNDSIDGKKFKKVCPNFYAIYETILTDDYNNKELLIKDDDVYLKTSTVRSVKYDHHSFLKVIMDSPNFSDPIRVFSTDNFIEIFENKKKSFEGQLDQFLELREIDEEDMDDDYEFKYSEKQKASIEKFTNNQFGYPLEFRPIAKTNLGSIQYDGFWPIDFFKFVLGDSRELFEEPLYGVLNKHIKYQKDREIRVAYSNISKCVFRVNEIINFEKLMLLRCGIDESLREDAINYSDDINLFNYLAYDGLLLDPSEVIYRDKGIEIKPTLRDGDEDLQPAFCSFFID